MREYRKRSSSLCLWMAIFRRAALSFTWDSKRMANKAVQATALRAAPDSQRSMEFGQADPQAEGMR